MKHTLVFFSIIIGFFANSQYNMIITQPSSPCLPAEVLFQPDIQGSFGAIQISFGDGSPEAINYDMDPFTYTYTMQGSYPVQINFYDANFNLAQQTFTTINLSNYLSHTISSSAQTSNLIGSLINFNFSTNESNVSISWDFGDGNISNDTNPSHAYSAAGSFTVTATIQSPNCGIVTRTLTVNVIDATLTIDIPVNCAPATVNFTINSNDPAVQYYSFAGGNGFQTGITTSNTTPIIYNNSGNNVVQIGLYDASQNPIAFISQTFVLDGDDYTITTNMLANLLSLNEQTEFNWFANNSTTPPAPSSASWNFGNGATSNAVSPTYAYPSAGTFNVVVEYMQSCGTLATESMTVTVADVNIDFTPVASCAPTSMTFDFVGTNDAENFAWFVQDIFGTIIYQSGNTADDFLNYTFINPGTYYVVLQAFEVGSTLIGTKAVEVNINGPTASTTEISTCDNQYTWTDGNTYTSAGSYMQQLTNAAGCDSIATLELAFLPSDQTTESQTACSSYLWSENGQTYNTSGNYTVVLTNQFGCDSTIILDLIIDEPTAGSVSVSACEEHVENGITYTQSGVYTQTLTNVAGCDSTLTLDITINDPNNLNSSVTACDQFTWNGTTYNSTGIYTYEETVGCVGTYTLDLTITEPYNETLQEAACDEFTWNGVTYTTSGTYSFNGTTVDGCDSTVVLDLTINESPIAQISVNNGFELTATAGDSFEWLDCDNGYAVIANETNQVFVAPNGNYAVKVTTAGCSDTSACVSVENSTVSIIQNNLELIRMYPNPASNEVILSNMPENAEVFIVNMQGKVVNTSQARESNQIIGVRDLSPGIYFVKILANNNAIVQKLVVKH
jgi:PKD repeat protein